MSKFIHLDIMQGGRYVTTLHMPHCPAFRLMPEELVRFVEGKVPRLAKAAYKIIFEGIEVMVEPKKK